jgi:hypothetical protein
MPVAGRADLQTESDGCSSSHDQVLVAGTCNIGQRLQDLIDQRAKWPGPTWSPGGNVRGLCSLQTIVSTG